jgi:hypothetical protein
LTEFYLLLSFLLLRVLVAPVGSDVLLVALAATGTFLWVSMPPPTFPMGGLFYKLNS